MVLQNIIFPNKDICNKSILYYRQEHGKVFSQESLLLKKGSICSFFTYFNGFSLTKWQKYTNISNFQLNICLHGKGKVYLCHSELQDEIPVEKIIEERTFEETSKTQDIELTFNIPKDIRGGIVFFKLQAKEEVIFYSGSYTTTENIVNKTNIAVGICTYRREEYINRTLNLISDAFLNNAESPLYGNLKVYISDNGSTLDCDKISGKFITCVHNKNAGGTGGFTRCMIEALKEQEDKHYTHFLFMDDDIILEPETLYRTYTLLCMCSEKYKDASVGGALLRTDFMEIQHASGEYFNNGRMKSFKEGYDLSKKYFLLANEKPVRENYNGWWYCCIPFDNELAKSLPLPLFIHRDDVEYNIRHVKMIIHLNGISVWHNTFENRRASNLEYYNTRNLFIINAIHNPNYNWKQAQKQLFIHMIGQLCKYNYKHKELFVRAVEDFCKGPDFLKEQEPVALHQDIMKMGYNLKDVSSKLDEYKKSWRYEKIEKKSLYKTEKFKLRHIIFLNGWLLPGYNKLFVFPVGIFISHLFRVKKVLYYEPETGKGFVCKRSYKELFSFLKTMYYIHCIMRKSYDKAALEYRNRYQELINLDFWKHYLDIKD